MLPEQIVRRALGEQMRRLRFDAALDALLAASAAAALVSALGMGAIAAIAAALITCAFVVVLASKRWTEARVARQIESAQPALQNLLVTAQESLAGRAMHPMVARELFAQAADRLRSLPPSRPRGARARLALVAAAVAAASLFVVRGPARPNPSAPGGDAVEVSRPSDAGAFTLRVTVVPPAYTRLAASTIDNPVQVQALEGSAIRLHVPDANTVHLVEPGRDPQTFMASAEGAALEIPATTSRVFLIRTGAAGSEPAADRLLQLQVQRDERPVVTIEQPGRDLLFSTSVGAVPVVITARDDLNVAAVMLRYTRIAGSGETFTFEEGELPLRVSPATSAPSRKATGTLVLSALKLEDGDTLVYRALARDDKPGADPVASESFLIEIGKRGEASSTGFSLPEDRDRQGLSQQMLIMKTERLQAERAKLSAAAVLERSQLLAVEQRMVRAEFVFMTGGEVVDEVEEAAHSHEIAAGRFENDGQIELLNAVREMSRAEARLNAGDIPQALVFERAALLALERAFDRRRYFLRTLPERARIDPSRRFSGDVTTAKPAAPSRPARGGDPFVEEVRDTIAALSAAVQRRSGFDAALAARVIAIDPQSIPLQRLAIDLSSNSSTDERAQAAAQARAHLAALLRQRLGPAATHQLRARPLTGFFPREGR
jgi:hypothetical protein